MTTEEKKLKIKELTTLLLNASHQEMLNKIDTALNSGAIDVTGWDVNHRPFVVPYSIATALLQRESACYNGRGTSFEKEVKREAKNILHFV